MNYSINGSRRNPNDWGNIPELEIHTREEQQAILDQIKEDNFRKFQQGILEEKGQQKKSTTTTMQANSKKPLDHNTQLQLRAQQQAEKFNRHITFNKLAKHSMALAGGAALAYAVYNNPVMINEGVSFVCRHVGSSMTVEGLNNLLKGQLNEIVAVGVGVAGCVVGPAMYAAIKTLLGKVLNIFTKIWEYRVALLTLAAIGLVAYYNPTVNGMVTSYLAKAVNAVVDVVNTLLSKLGTGVNVDYLKSSSISVNKVGISLALIAGIVPMMKLLSAAVKMAWKNPTIALSLMIAGLLAYYNPTVNGVVTPYYTQAVKAAVDGANYMQSVVNSYMKA